MAPFLALFMDVLKVSEYGILHLADTDQQQFFLISLGSFSLKCTGSNIPISEGYQALWTSALLRVNGGREGIYTAWAHVGTFCKIYLAANFT